MLEGCLTRCRRLHVVFQAFNEAEVPATAGRLTAVLTRHGFAVAEVLVEDRSVCVVAGPAG